MKLYNLFFKKTLVSANTFGMLAALKQQKPKSTTSTSKTFGKTLSLCLKGVLCSNHKKFPGNFNERPFSNTTKKPKKAKKMPTMIKLRFHHGTFHSKNFLLFGHSIVENSPSEQRMNVETRLTCKLLVSFGISYIFLFNFSKRVIFLIFPKLSKTKMHSVYSVASMISAVIKHLVIRVSSMHLEMFINIWDQQASVHCGYGRSFGQHMFEFER